MKTLLAACISAALSTSAVAGDMYFAVDGPCTYQQPEWAEIAVSDDRIVMYETDCARERDAVASTDATEVGMLTDCFQEEPRVPDRPYKILWQSDGTILIDLGDGFFTGWPCE